MIETIENGECRVHSVSAEQTSGQYHVTCLMAKLTRAQCHGAAYRRILCLPHPTEERTLPGAVRVKFFGKQLDEIWV